MVAVETPCLDATSMFERYSVATGAGLQSVHRRVYYRIRCLHGAWARRWWRTGEEQIWEAFAIGHPNKRDDHGRLIDGTTMLQNHRHCRCWIYRESANHCSVSVRFRSL